ncbi:MAG TPA: hypothetical protein VHF58_01435 [Solirubrobacterales bacterium]|nr:hypothetical protein [Solirubrobacterales bacterium]
MKRFAAVLSVASVLAIGGSSTASAAGDPLHVHVCNESIFGCLPVVDVSVDQVAPGVGSYVCSPQNETVLPPLRVPFDIPGVVSGAVQAQVAICEQ